MRSIGIVSFVSLLAVSCGGSEGGEDARAVVEAAWAAQEFSGAVGVEAVGKGVWFRAEAINAGCLHSKNWAFADNKGSTPRLTPTYEQQAVFQLPTDAGFCIYIGDDLTMKTDAVNQLEDAWIVDAVFDMARPGSWWECVDEHQKRFPTRVVPSGPDGALQIEHDPALFGGGCPAPIPVANLSRSSSRRPARPARSPNRSDVVQAAKRLDEALWSHDLQAALDATACYNLYEKDKVGSCSAAELANVGPLQRGEVRRADGPPWSMNAFKDLDAIGTPEPDRKDKTIFHAQVKEAKGKHKRRTISVQWADDTFKLVGVVQRKAEGLTSVEYVVDLDRKDKREIFDRRMLGEEIDWRGEPLNPEQQQPE